jgi:hydroxypyruvate isomerase
MKRRQFMRNSLFTGASLATSAIALGKSDEKGNTLTNAEKTFNLDYAFHPGTFRNLAGDDIIDQIKYAYDNGFRAMEDNGMKGRDTALQQKIGDTLAKLGMKMGVFVSHDIDWQKPLLSAGDKEKREKYLSQIKESVEVAKRVGTKWMVSVPGVIAPSLDIAYQKAHVLETLRRATDILQPHGLVLLLEPLNFRDHPGQLLPDVPNIYSMIKSVNSPAIKMIFDVYHVQIDTGNIIPNIDLAWDEIAYVQTGDNPGRKEPTTGEINYKNVFKHLYNKGFKGIVGMEHGNSKPGKEGELALIKAYRDSDSFL